MTRDKKKWAEYMLEWTRKNRDRVNEQRRAKYASSEENRRKIYEAHKNWRERNPDKKRAYANANWRKWAKPEVAAAWRRRNREKLNEQARARYHAQEKDKVQNLLKAARRRRALCAWANEERIAEIYAEARFLTKATGIKHVVDHIVPIRNALVCGLHNEYNLRVITQTENAIKKNRFEVIA